MLRTAIAVGLAAAFLQAPALAETTSTETVRLWEVDMSGRPPFKRRFVEVPAIDVASMETDVMVKTERVRTTDFNGRPPFKRSYEELPVIDAAALEAQGSSSGISPAKPKPFFKKRHR